MNKAGSRPADPLVSKFLSDFEVFSSKRNDYLAQDLNPGNKQSHFLNSYFIHTDNTLPSACHLEQVKITYPSDGYISNNITT